MAQVPATYEDIPLLVSKEEPLHPVKPPSSTHLKTEEAKQDEKLVEKEKTNEKEKNDGKVAKSSCIWSDISCALKSIFSIETADNKSAFEYLAFDSSFIKVLRNNDCYIYRKSNTIGFNGTFEIFLNAIINNNNNDNNDDNSNQDFVELLIRPLCNLLIPKENAVPFEVDCTLMCIDNSKPQFCIDSNITEITCYLQSDGNISLDISQIKQISNENIKNGKLRIFLDNAKLFVIEDATGE